MDENNPTIPGPRRPLDSRVLSESLSFDATLSFRVTLTRAELTATRRHMVERAIADGHESANESWFTDQDVVEYQIYEWIASGNNVATVTSTESTVWTA